MTLAPVEVVRSTRSAVGKVPKEIFFSYLLDLS